MDQFERELIEYPPDKNPYFTLPDTANFITAQEAAQAAFDEKRYNSLVDLFGVLDKMSDEQSTQFLLHLLKNSIFQPDFDATADALNVANGHQVKRRLEGILKDNGFSLDMSNMVQGGTLPKDAKPARPSTKEAKKARLAKIAERKGIESSPGSGNLEEFTPMKKRRSTDDGTCSVRRGTRTRHSLDNIDPELIDDDVEHGADVEDNGVDAE